MYALFLPAACHTPRLPPSATPAPRARAPTLLDLLARPLPAHLYLPPRACPPAACRSFGDDALALHGTVVLILGPNVVLDYGRRTRRCVAHVVHSVPFAGGRRPSLPSPYHPAPPPPPTPTCPPPFLTLVPDSACHYTPSSCNSTPLDC